MVEYTYDDYGYITGKTGSLKDTVGTKNPYRYRSYRYDEETGLYYLNARYYNPEWGRFISADSPDLLLESLDGFYDKNLFTYCDADPINKYDDDGQFWNIVIGAAVGGVVNAALTAVTQYVTTGKVDFVSVGISFATGAASGAIAATGLGMFVQAGISAGISGVGNALEQVNQNGFNNFDFKQCLSSAGMGFATSLIGSAVGKLATKNISKTGDKLLKKGQAKYNKGCYNKSIGKSHSNNIRKGLKYMAQGIKTINISYGTSSVIGTGTGAVMYMGYTYVTIRHFEW